MINIAPLIVVDDDLEDQDTFKEAFENLKYPNELIFFDDGQSALAFLNETDIKPFLILCDINMPGLNGFDLRTRLKANRAMELRCVPFLFFSTANNQKVVVDAYSLSVQGFFVKEYKMRELEKTITAIMEYWKRCTSPNNYPIN
jgi:CheY-like chemotaxis protein